MQHSSTQTWVLVLQTWQQVKLTNVSLVGACLFRPPQTTKHGQIVELPGHAHIFLRIRAFLKMLETMEFREFIFLGSKI